MTISPRHKFILYAFLAIGLVLLIGHNALLYPETAQCLFKLQTGLLCPGCGAQRSLHALLQMDLIHSVKYNFLIPLSLVALIGLSILLMIDFESTWSKVNYIASHIIFRWSLLVLVLGYWIFRNI